MAIFLYRLNPPRPTFPADITAEEGAAMQSHFGYWHDQMNRGTTLVFGPVADPQGAHGIAILSMPNEAEAKAICTADPAITARLGFNFALYEMPNAVAKGADV